MTREVLAYQSPGCQPARWPRIVKGGLLLTLAVFVSAAQALPTSIGHGHSLASISTEYKYGWLGTYLRVTHQFYFAAPATTAREIFWLPLIWNLMAVAAVWVICLIYAQRQWLR